MDAAKVAELRAYIERYETHMDRHMLPLCNPEGRRVLVLGSGWGTETYWALKRGASFVYGIDPAPRSTEPLAAALSAAGLPERFNHAQGLIWDVPAEVGPFDAIISNNVFEHIFGLSATLAACRPHIPKRGARVHVFTDPLFFSSAGAHLPIGPWEHLTETQSALAARPETATGWGAYREQLNGMTITSFLDAVREAGMWIEQMSIVPDRNRATFPALMDALPPGVKPMDLLLEGIGCTLAFPENC